MNFVKNEIVEQQNFSFLFADYINRDHFSNGLSTWLILTKWKITNIIDKIKKIKTQTITTFDFCLTNLSLGITSGYSDRAPVTYY